MPNESLSNSVAFAVRSVDDAGNETTQIVTRGDLQVHRLEGEPTTLLTFKTSGHTVDIQPVDLKELNLTDSEIYIPLPQNPKQVECTADSPKSAVINWGLPGGSESAFKIIHDTKEDDVKNDIGCSSSTNVPELSGNVKSYSLSNLQPKTNYFVRICSKNNSTPSKTSPGVFCYFRTPSLDTPTLQLVYTTNSNSAFYAKKSQDDWTAEKIASNLQSNIFFEMDKRDNPFIILANAGKKYYLQKESGVFVTKIIPDTISSAAMSSLGNVLIDIELKPLVLMSFATGYSLASLTSGAWSKNDYNIGSNTSIFTKNSSAIDKLDNYYVASDSQMFTRDGDGNWTSQNHSVGVKCQTTPTGVFLASDFSGEIHGAYLCRAVSGDCNLYYFSGTDLSSATKIDVMLKNSVCSANKVALSFDKDDVANILYSMQGTTSSFQSIKLATNKSGTFKSEEIYTSEATGIIKEIELALDAKGTAHVAFGEDLVNRESNSCECNVNYLYYKDAQNKEVSAVAGHKYSSCDSYTYEPYACYTAGLKINEMKSNSAR